MKFTKLTADVSLGMSIALFSYVYWFVYELEQYGSMGRSTEDITNVTVDLFTVAFLLSTISVIFRGMEIKTKKEFSLLNKVLLTISLVPFLKVLVSYFVCGLK